MADVPSGKPFEVICKERNMLEDDACYNDGEIPFSSSESVGRISCKFLTPVRGMSERCDISTWSFTAYNCT